MNRSAFHKRLARATVAVVLTTSAIGCATAPESAPTPQTPPTEVSSAPSEHLATDPLPERPDVSLRLPVASPPETDSPKLEEPSPVWIDDTLTRQSPAQPTVVAVQEPPPPEIDVRAPSDRSPAPATAPETARRETRTESTPAGRVTAAPATVATPDRPLAIIEPRVPAPQRPARGQAAASATPAAEPAAEPAPAPEPVRAAVPAPAPEPVPAPAPAPAATPTPSSTGPAPTSGDAISVDAVSADAATAGGLSSGGTTPGSANSGAATSRPATGSTPVETPAPSEPAVSREPESLSSATEEPTSTRSTALWNERAASIASGSEFSVVLPGSGWLYVGKEYGDGEIRLLGKSRSGGDEVFRFRIGESGDYGLWFQQQDSLSGSLLNERLSVRAGEDEDATTITLADLAEGSTLSSLSPPETSTEATDSADGVAAVTGLLDEPPSADALDRAVQLLDEGQPGDAIAAFIDGADRGAIGLDSLDDDLLGRFVEAARSSSGEESGRSSVIRSFWRRVASSGSAAAPEARRALLEIATRSGDGAEIEASISALEAAGEASADDMISAADALFSADRETAALPLLARAASRDESALEAIGLLEDDRLFELARLLEQPGPDRDLRRAASLYRLILDDRPLSAHWDESRSRLEYLRRHYFEVR